jgi:transposase
MRSNAGVEAYVMHVSSIAVSREHRRAKTNRLDTELLMRVFLGWSRGERRHCSMAAIPTIEEEDAKRPNREHEKLVGDRTRIMNRMKSTLSRLGIRGFKPTLRKADEKLSELRTAEGTLLPENTRAELRRDITRLRVVREQLKESEQNHSNEPQLDGVKRATIHLWSERHHNDLRVCDTP